MTASTTSQAYETARPLIGRPSHDVATPRASTSTPSATRTVRSRAPTNVSVGGVPPWTLTRTAASAVPAESRVVASTNARVSLASSAGPAASCPRRARAAEEVRQLEAHVERGHVQVRCVQDQLVPLGRGRRHGRPGGAGLRDRPRHHREVAPAGAAALERRHEATLAARHRLGRLEDDRRSGRILGRQDDGAAGVRVGVARAGPGRRRAHDAGAPQDAAQRRRVVARHDRGARDVRADRHFVGPVARRVRRPGEVQNGAAGERDPDAAAAQIGLGVPRHVDGRARVVEDDLDDTRGRVVGVAADRRRGRRRDALRPGRRRRRRRPGRRAGRRVRERDDDGQRHDGRKGRRPRAQAVRQHARRKRRVQIRGEVRRGPPRQHLEEDRRRGRLDDAPVTVTVVSFIVASRPSSKLATTSASSKSAAATPSIESEPVDVASARVGSAVGQAAVGGAVGGGVDAALGGVVGARDLRGGVSLSLRRLRGPTASVGTGTDGADVGADVGAEDGAAVGSRPSARPSARRSAAWPSASASTARASGRASGPGTRRRRSAARRSQRPPTACAGGAPARPSQAPRPDPRRGPPRAAATASRRGPSSRAPRRRAGHGDGRLVHRRLEALLEARHDVRVVEVGRGDALHRERAGRRRERARRQRRGPGRRRRRRRRRGRRGARRGRRRARPARGCLSLSPSSARTDGVCWHRHRRRRRRRRRRGRRRRGRRKRRGRKRRQGRRRARRHGRGRERRRGRRPARATSLFGAPRRSTPSRTVGSSPGRGRRSARRPGRPGRRRPRPRRRRACATR